jgi:hypothetical protein
MVKVKPIGTSPVPYVAGFREEVPDTEIDMMPLDQAIIYLRGKKKEPGETFPWPLVERFVQAQDSGVKSMEEFSFFPLPEKPEPQAGYKWYWADDMAFLSGRGGLLEVNITEKKQGRFIRTCRS